MEATPKRKIACLLSVNCIYLSLYNLYHIKKEETKEKEKNYKHKKLHGKSFPFFPLMLTCLKQTDPNWSNFLYDESEKMINLIDFGAARDYPKSFVDDYLRMVRFLCLLELLWNLLSSIYKL